MFDPDSRYAKAPIHRRVDDQDREVAFVLRRIIPDTGREVARMRVQDGDRRDLMAARAYDAPAESWRIMDANPDPEPLRLADRPGRRLSIRQIEPE